MCSRISIAELQFGWVYSGWVDIARFDPFVFPRLYITSTTDTSGVVDVLAGVGAGQIPYSVKANQITMVEVPSPNGSRFDLGTNGVRNWAVHVSSQTPISVSVVYYGRAVTDSILAYPARSYGSEYFLSSMGTLADTRKLPRSTIIATQDNTTVTVSPTTALEVDGVMIEPGQTAQFTINRGEDYHLRSTREDLSGTSIVSDKPVAVFSGHGCAFLPSSAWCNRLAEQLLPTTLWAKRYITTPLKTRVGDYFRVFSSVDNTELKVNGVLNSVLNRGEFATIKRLDASEFTASHPIQVIQHSTGKWYDLNLRLNDPHSNMREEILYHPAAWSSEYVVEIDPAPAENYVFVIIAEAAKSSLQLDGIPVDTRIFGHAMYFGDAGNRPKPDRPYTTTQIALNRGLHTLSASEPFAVLKNINAVDQYADPAMSVVQPAQSYLSAYSFQVPDTGGFSRNFINITIPLTSISNVTLDGELIDPAYFEPITNTEFAFARLGVNIGPHYIFADAAFGLMLYGYDDADAYFHLGGWAFNQSQTVSTLTLQSDNTAPTVTTDVCLTTTAFDTANNTVAFATIDLVVAGTQNNQITLTANQSGVASYCYQGIYTGSDNISVTSGVAQASLAINWSLGAGNHAPVIISKPILLVQDTQAYSYSVKAIDADNDQLTYSLVNPPAGMTIDSISGVISWLAVAGQYAVDVMVSDTATNNTQQQYTLVVNRTPILVELPATIILSQQIYTSRLGASDPDGDTLYYRLTQGGSQFSVNSRTGQINSADPMALGSYPITIEVSDHKGGAWSYSYILLVDGVNVAPTISTPVTSFSIIAGEVVEFDITASDLNGDAVVINVTAGQLPGLAINPSTGHVVWTSDNAVVGNHQVTVVGIDAWGATSNSVTLDFNVAENLPPQITSTPPTVAYVGQLFEYPITFNDPESRPVVVNLDWGGLTPSSINSDNVLSWMPTKYYLGKNITMQVSATDDIGQAHNQVFSYLVRNVNTAPPSLISGLPYQAFVGISLINQLQAEDPDGGPIDFSEISGPTGLTISPTGLIEWTPLLTQTGDQPVTVRISDGELFQDYSWTINTLLTPLPLEANIIVDPINIAPGDTTLLTVQVLGGIEPSIESVTVDGVAVTLIGEQATLTSDIIGRHDIVVTLNDQGVSTTFSSYFTVIDPADTSYPEVTIESPVQGQEITSQVPIIISASDENIVDVVLLVRKRDTEESTELYRGNVSVSSQAIAEFDPTLLRNGQYHLVLQATDVNGLIRQTINPVIVTGGKKIGNFSITLQDLNIPVGGIPITVSRTYDSRRKNELLDFGYGWSIDYQNISVEESTEPTIGWNRSLEGQVFKINGSPVNFQATCMRPLPEKIVTVTLPNDDVEKFTARLRGLTGSLIAESDPDCDLTPSDYFDLFFDPYEDTDSTLEAYNDTDMFLNGAGNLVADIIDEIPVNITKYRLTTRFGFVYNLDQNFGIESVIDPNGNSLTYSDTGIVHSSGKSVSFNRDSDGLITRITDPNGNQIDYQYNSNIDLVTSTDALINSTVYRYDNTHGLVDIEDPLGRNLIRNIYDADGRLIAQEDSDGNRTEFNHDIAGNQSTVFNRLGYATQYVYDDRGNVVSEVDALGNVTSYSYDANDNQLSKTDGLGNTSSATYNATDDQLTQVDELGQVVSFTYNDLGQELTITDESGDVFTNTYDLAGNLLSITDPQNNIASNTINIQGLPATVQDALGNITSFTYDGDGRKLTETNALNETTTFTVDANSNVLTESNNRTLDDGSIVTETTTFVYDSMDRVIQITDALGNVTQTEYDSVGNEAANIDALGRRTEMDYDPYGSLIETRYPDNTIESKTYDTEGNQLTETDRLGRVTLFEYDALNRLIKTTLANGSFTQTEYDAVGQVSAEIDANGNRSTHEYDLAGRRINTTDASFNVHHFAYDVDGNLTSETDALGRTTTFVYDSLDRKIQTTFFDSSIMQEGYDALARKTSTTDQASVVTDFDYDALGRLISVTDVLANVTSYTYDEAGNKLTQTDAEGRTTSWSYDALGRVLTRTLPLGQVESMNYDAVGNLINKTDFNGNLITYDYDSSDRLILITYAQNGSTESYTYDTVGNRLTATNSQGIWSYSYDNLNRLVTETKPGGELLQYSYDANGNKTELKITYVNGTIRTETNTYDVLNRLETVTDNDANITSYGYDAVGNRTSVSYQNGSSQTYSYDTLNRLTSLSHFDGNGGLINQYDYTLHATGRRTEIVESTGRASTYSYDDAYRLTNETIIDSINDNHTADYQYDPVGNRTFSIINGVSTAYTYDNNDRLTQQGGETFTYDDMGNTLTKSVDSDITSYGYDARQNLITADITQGGINTMTSYQYNPDGIRTQAIENGITTNFLVDANRDYAQVIAETDSINVIIVEYIHGDDLISQKRGVNTTNYLYDGLGSTRTLTDSAGNSTDQYYYDAFGNTLATSGITENDYLYAGEQFDSALDNYYLRARYYDPGVGRFMQMDTWMGRSNDPVSLHKYLYANVDPVNNIDPSGLFSLPSLNVGISIRGSLSSVSTRIYAKQFSKALWGEVKGAAKDQLNQHAFGIIGDFVVRRMVGAVSSTLDVGQSAQSFGSSAHKNLSDLIQEHSKKINNYLKKYNARIEVEVFRFSSGERTSTKSNVRKKGSMGIDVTVIDTITGKVLLGFDLKTGKSGTASKKIKGYRKSHHNADIFDIFLKRKR